MKKLLIVLGVLILSFSNVLVYNPTSKYEKVLNNIYGKLDSILEKSPSKIEKLYNQVSKIKYKVKHK